MEPKTPKNSFWNYFEDLEDGRSEGRNKTHSLRNVITFAVVGFSCGQRSFSALEEFSSMQMEWLRPYLDPLESSPCRDTFRRVFEVLDPVSFERAFTSWTASLEERQEGESICIDGKTVRNSGRTNERPLHLVSAWAATRQLVLGQVATQEKSNEITAIPELLELLHIEKCLVTIDAMGCQKTIAEAICDKNADYLLAVKDNHPTMHREIRDYFSEFRNGRAEHPMSFHEESDKGHGRLETRRCFVTTDVEWFEEQGQWKNLSLFAMIESERTIKNKTTIETRYYIGSEKSADAKRVLNASREHWGIENKLHWCLDVTFGEDHACVRDRVLAHNIAVIRRVVTNLLRKLPGYKGNVAAAQRKAAFDLNFRETLMNSIT